jgi:histidyl-tRNA synthetase
MNNPKISTKPPSGMRDFLPEELGRAARDRTWFAAVYGRYGFVPLETPTIENLSTLLGKYGDEGDQLLYRILHRRDGLARALAEPGVSQATLADEGLRYDLTVPLARVVAQYELPKFFKRYQIQPVWRADRPGKGRFREFYQCDVDITGTTSLVAEAEVCAAVAEVLHALGFADFKIRVNHRQLLRAMMLAAGIDLAHEAAAMIAIDKLDKIGQGGVREELARGGSRATSANSLMMLVLTGDGAVEGLFGGRQAGRRRGCSGSASRSRIPAASRRSPSSSSCSRCSRRRRRASTCSLSLDLARGLGYYTGAIFEIAVPDLAGSLGGGGRYDELVGMFGKKQLPAVGFSLGLERILVVMEERKMFPALSAGPDLLLCWMGVELPAVLGVAHKLRAQGLKIEVFPRRPSSASSCSTRIRRGSRRRGGDRRGGGAEGGGGDAQAPLRKQRASSAVATSRSTRSWPLLRSAGTAGYLAGVGGAGRAAGAELGAAVRGDPRGPQRRHHGRAGGGLLSGALTDVEHAVVAARAAGRGRGRGVCAPRSPRICAAVAGAAGAVVRTEVVSSPARAAAGDVGAL